MTVTRPGSVRANKLPMVPVAPLMRIVMPRIRALEKTVGREEACAFVGATGRQINHWEAGTYTQTRYDVADRMLIALGLNWFDVWDEDEYPEVHRRLER